MKINEFQITIFAQIAAVNAPCCLTNILHMLTEFWVVMEAFTLWKDT